MHVTKVEEGRVHIFVYGVTLVFESVNDQITAIARSSSSQIHNQQKLSISPLHFKEAQDTARAILLQQQKKKLADSKQKKLF